VSLWPGLLLVLGHVSIWGLAWLVCGLLWAREDSGSLCLVGTGLGTGLGTWVMVRRRAEVVAAAARVCICRAATVIVAAAIVEAATASSSSAVLCRVIVVVVSWGGLDGDVAEDHAPQLILEGAGIFGLHGRDSVCAVRAERRWLLGDTKAQR
jgi:hypothetical protein